MGLRDTRHHRWLLAKRVTFALIVERPDVAARSQLRHTCQQ